MAEQDPNLEKHYKGYDFTLKIDDEFRERLINELRTYPNILLICGDEANASHTIQCTEEWKLAQAVISVCKREPQLKKFLIQCLQHV